MWPLNSKPTQPACAARHTCMRVRATVCLAPCARTGRIPERVGRRGSRDAGLWRVGVHACPEHLITPLHVWVRSEDPPSAPRTIARLASRVHLLGCLAM